MEVGAHDVQPLDRVMGIVWLANPHPLPKQWNQAPVILIYQLKNKGDRGKRMIQRLNEESGCQEKHCTEHMEVTQARQTALEPND